MVNHELDCLPCRDMWLPKLQLEENSPSCLLQGFQSLEKQRQISTARPTTAAGENQRHSAKEGESDSRQEEQHTMDLGEPEFPLNVLVFRYVCPPLDQFAAYFGLYDKTKSTGNLFSGGNVENLRTTKEMHFWNFFGVHFF